MHDNDINIIPEWILLHDVLNPYKFSKHNNGHYFPTMYGCMNKRIDREKINIEESGCSSKIVTRRISNPQKSMTQWKTQEGNITTHHKVKIYFTLNGFSATKL